MIIIGTLLFKCQGSYFVTRRGYPIISSEVSEKVLSQHKHSQEPIVEQAADYDFSKDHVIGFNRIKLSKTIDKGN